MTAAFRQAISSAVAVICLAVSVRAGQAPGRDAQPTIKSTGLIAGVVTIDGRTKGPAPECVVTLTGGAFPSGQIAVTDEHGRFVFDGLVPGHYTLSTAKPSYVSAYFGSKRPGRGPGTPIVIEDGQHVNDLALALIPGAVIAGVTFDHLGRRQPNATVLVVDAASLHPDGSARAVLTTRSDSAGQYRAAGLPSGTYLVVARPLLSFSGARVPTAEEIDEVVRDPAATKPLVAIPGPALNVTPTFFPAAVDPVEAVPIAIAAGELREGVDIAMQVVRSARVTGRAVSPGDVAPKGLQLSMISPAIRIGFDDRVQSGNLRGIGVVPAKADGTFDQSALPPGHYSYFARAIDPSTGDAKTATPTLWASVDLDVNGRDVPDLVIRLQPGVAVTGRLVADAGRTAPDWSSGKLSLEPTDNGPHLAVPPAVVGADGSFAFRGVAPGTYDLIATGVQRWTAKAVVAAGADVGDHGIAIGAGQDVSDVVVTMTDQAPSVAGRLVDAGGRPAPEYDIVLFPADRSAWTTARRIRSTRPATDGRYAISGLQPGEYLVAAVTEVSSADLADVSFLQMLASSAVHVALAMGDTRTVDLRIATRDR